MISQRGLGLKHFRAVREQLRDHLGILGVFCTLLSRPFGKIDMNLGQGQNSAGARFVESFGDTKRTDVTADVILVYIGVARDHSGDPKDPKT